MFTLMENLWYVNPALHIMEGKDSVHYKKKKKRKKQTKQNRTEQNKA